MWFVIGKMHHRIIGQKFREEWHNIRRFDAAWNRYIIAIFDLVGACPFKTITTLNWEQVIACCLDFAICGDDMVQISWFFARNADDICIYQLVIVGHGWHFNIDHHAFKHFLDGHLFSAAQRHNCIASQTWRIALGLIE